LLNSSRATQYTRQAVSLGRRFLALRVKDREVSDLQLANARTVLGGALVAAAATEDDPGAATRTVELDEAECLLLDGDRSLRASSEAPAAILNRFQREALQDLVRLYGVWNKQAPSGDRAKKLAEFQARLAATRK
jgi:hypothetical protein